METDVEAPGLEPRDAAEQDRAGEAVVGVAKAFGDVRALDGVSLRIRGGTTVAVGGPGGCGKPTLLELVWGRQRPDAGRIAAPPAARMPQRDALLPWLSA